MKLNRNVVVVLVLSFAVVFFATYYSISNSRQSAELADSALNSEHQIARLEHIYTVIFSADEGVKNYIVTGNESLLVTPDSSFAKFNRTINAIKGNMRNDSVLMNEANMLGKYGNAKLQFIEVLTKARRQSFDSAQKMIAWGKGMALNDSIKSVISRMQKLERNGRTKFVSQNEISINRTSNIIIVGFFIVLLIIFIVLLFLNRGIFIRIASEQKVSEGEIRYRTMGENAGRFIYTCDYYGKINFATPNIITLTGYTEAEILGKDFTFMVSPEWVEPVKEAKYIQFKHKIKEETTEFEIITKQGQRKWIEQDVVIFSTQNMEMGFQCTIREIKAPALIVTESGALKNNGTK